VRKIHQVFKNPDEVKNLIHGRCKLCWYPSAEEDFRHIAFLEAEGLEHTPGTEPLVYIHTDMRMPDFLTKERPSASSGPVLKGMKITRISELHLKRPIRDVSDIYTFEADKNTGRSFVFQVDLEQTFRGRKISVHVPVLYIMSENLVFLVNFFLLYGLKVDTLVHIKDGGGTMGGSYFPMDFIYQVTNLIKLKRVLSDISVEGKSFDTVRDYSILDAQCRRYLGRHYTSRRLLRHHSEDEIKSSWQSEPISRGLFPSNAYSRTREDHDWRPASPSVGHGSDTGANDWNFTVS